MKSNRHLEKFTELKNINKSVEKKSEPIIKENKKGFYLIVRSSFDDYKKGDIVSDFDAIEKIEKNSGLSLCIKVNSKGI